MKKIDWLAPYKRYIDIVDYINRHSSDQPTYIHTRGVGEQVLSVWDLAMFPNCNPVDFKDLLKVILHGGECFGES